MEIATSAKKINSKNEETENKVFKISFLSKNFQFSCICRK